MFSDCMWAHTIKLFFIAQWFLKWDAHRHIRILWESVTKAKTCMTFKSYQVRKWEELGKKFDTSINTEYRYDAHSYWRTVTLDLCFPTVIEIQQKENMITLVLSKCFQYLMLPWTFLRSNLEILFHKPVKMHFTPNWKWIRILNMNFLRELR